jgi:iron uptake system EfeUOB component EfeO/EfeM
MARVYRHRASAPGPGGSIRASSVAPDRWGAVHACGPSPTLDPDRETTIGHSWEHRTPSRTRRYPDVVAGPRGQVGPMAVNPPRPRRSPTAVATATVVLAAAAVLVAACTSGSPTSQAQPSSPPSIPVARLAGTDRSPAGTDRSLARAASAAYRTTIAVDAGALVADVGRLQGDLGSDDIPAARSDELSAQAAYDGIRLLLEAADPVIAATLDEQPSMVAPGQTPAGLHAVEADLWSTPPADALTDMTGVVAQAPVAEYLLERDVLAPAIIGTTAVDELDWVDVVAIPGHEEVVSHLDAVDMAATVDAARAAYAAIQPLARQVSPTLAASVGRGFATLTAEVTALGPPDQRLDGTIPELTLRSLSQTVNATASSLAGLSAALVPFGTFGASY